MVNVIGISQFGFSAFFGAPTPPSGAVVGWTAVSSNADAILVSVPNASSAASEQLFNCYFFALPPGTQGQAFLLQSLNNGKYVVATTRTIAGAQQTVFTASGETQQVAAQFAFYSLGA